MPMQQTGGKKLAHLVPDLQSSPFSLMRRLSDEMERLFDGVGIGEPNWSRLWPTVGGGDRWSPNVDVYERKDQLVTQTCPA